MKKKETRKDIQADFEAMDMLKDEDYETTGGDYGDIESILESLNDSTRDIAIKCVDRLVKEGYVKDCTDTNDETEFSVQDIIHEEINKPINASEEVNELLNEACEIIALLEDIGGLSNHGYPDDSIEAQVNTFFSKITGINENPWNKEETCPKCDQHPYSETDRHCPVCFDEIKENK